MNTQTKAVLASLTLLFVLLAGCGKDTATEAGPAEQGHAEIGSAESEVDSADWCAEHAIAESACPYCNPTLIEELGWCAGHAVSEAMCWICNPAIIAAYKAVGDWCGGHDLPESRCLECNPELAEATSGTDTEEPAAEVAVPRYQRPPSVTCTTELLTVNFEREAVAQEAGLEFAIVGAQSLARTLECNAILDYDGNRFARLSPQVAGVVKTVAKDLGDQVEIGEIMAVIVSPDFGAAKAAYLQALASEALWARVHAREADLLTQGAATERDLLEAETSLAESRIAFEGHLRPGGPLPPRCRANRRALLRQRFVSRPT